MLAALLVMLGSESAAVILRQFQPREIEAISREMARFTLITREQQEQILRNSRTWPWRPALRFPPARR